eukprot:TRINITY_DN3643_c0_g1_i1.p1 TRINITY_DN3643_c0_g1~~TRINITY_DN3643_c0_g1_i1.p1  ORF type:complete len:73 (-),score=6.07 TRINITY_DN3643_c0_g1_i1:157-375(-)
MKGFKTFRELKKRRINYVSSSWNHGYIVDVILCVETSHKIVSSAFWVAPNHYYGGQGENEFVYFQVKIIGRY